VPFEVPQSIIDVDRTKLKDGAKLSDFITITNASGPVVINVNDGATNVYTLNGFVLDQFLNYIDGTAHVSDASVGLIGLFEQVSNDLFLKDGIYSLWAKDTADPPQTGKLPGQNMYGTHPFVMSKSKSGWFGVFTNVVAAQDWTVKRQTADIRVTMTATGGLGDMFFMVGKTANDVVKQYHTVVGKPLLVPQWTLGWAQCRWGYHNIEQVRDVIQKYNDNGLQLDTLVQDIDYLDRYRDFTVDPNNFNGLTDFVANLTAHLIHYVPIVDAGIAKRPGENYQAYDQGVAADIFIKNAQGGILTGNVWPEDAVFPDWFHPSTDKWWSDQLNSFFK